MGHEFKDIVNMYEGCVRSYEYFILTIFLASKTIILQMTPHQLFP